MSIATYIGSIEQSRNIIRNKLVALGLAATTDKLDALAAAIDEIVNRGSVQAQVKEGETYNIPAGFHDGSGTVSGVSGGGNYTLQSKSVTPTKKQQAVTADSGYYGLSDVVIAAIPTNYQDVSAVTITKDKALVGTVFVNAAGEVVVGEMLDNGNISATIDGLTVTSYTIPAGYTSGGTVSLTADIENALAAI